MTTITDNNNLEAVYIKDVTSFGILLSKVTTVYFKNDNKIMTVLTNLMDSIDKLKMDYSAMFEGNDNVDINDRRRIFVINCRNLCKHMTIYLRYIEEYHTGHPNLSSTFLKDFTAVAKAMLDLTRNYGTIIEIYSKNLQYQILECKNTINRKKYKYHMVQTTPTTYEEAVDRLLEDDSTIPTSQRIADSITSLFDQAGDAVNWGIDTLGKYIGKLFIKLGRGTEELSYANSVLLNKGFDAFLDDPRCVGCIRDAVLYGAIFLIAWSIVKSVLRKVGSLLNWLGN